MGGLLVVGVYVVFWNLCWLFSRWITKRSKSKKLIKQGFVFILIGALPFYLYLVDRAIYQNACSNAEIFFPETLYEKPEVIFYYESTYKNQMPIASPRNVFDYVAVPNFSTGIYSMTTDEVIANWDKIEIYPHQQERLQGEKREAFLKKLRFGLFHKSWVSEQINTGTHRTYIYDFEQKKEIAAYTTISYSRSVASNPINLLFPWSFNDCSYGGEQLTREQIYSHIILEKTFSLK